ncbi:PIN domain-containing protein [Streptomyces olivaceoviridis]
MDTIPTSEEALREAAFREANYLPPCKTSKGEKTGSRDAAIWLSAVEHVHQFPDETVYFVSANTKDFGAGPPYPSPMADDIAGVEDRFVYLTSMDEIVTRFTEPTTTNETFVVDILRSDQVQRAVLYAAQQLIPVPSGEPFLCLAGGPGGVHRIVSARSWMVTKASVHAVDSVRSYRIGDHEWCTAVVEWHLGGVLISEDLLESAWAGVSWTASVLFTPSKEEPRLTVLRNDPPRPLTTETFAALGLPVSEPTPLEQAVQGLVRAGATVVRSRGLHPLRGPRTYEGAWARRAAGVELGDISPG